MIPTTIDAVYQDGVFRPTTPVELPAGTKVQVTVLVPATPFDPEVAMECIRRASAKTRPGPIEYTSENVDAILYGRPGDPGDVR
jgi:predicted DNA-binding antitoxin AbrB/MazE fold protein